MLALALVALAVVIERPGLQVTSRDLVGTWAQSGGLEYDIPVERRIVFNGDGTGDTWLFLDFNGPGMGVPHAFNYTVRDGTVRLLYWDGHSEALDISSFSVMRFEAKARGDITYTWGGSWQRTWGGET
jgi:hypothetical protein